MLIGHNQKLIIIFSDNHTGTAGCRLLRLPLTVKRKAVLLILNGVCDGNYGRHCGLSNIGHTLFSGCSSLFGRTVVVILCYRFLNGRRAFLLSLSGKLIHTRYNFGTVLICQHIYPHHSASGYCSEKKGGCHNSCYSISSCHNLPPY